MANSEISSRLDTLIGRCGFRSLRSFATAAGVSPISFQGNVALGKEPRFSTLASILKSFPQISAEWLMRGEGDIFRADGLSAANVSHDGDASRSVGVENPANADASLIEQLRKENAALLDQLKVKDSQISALFAMLSK